MAQSRVAQSGGLDWRAEERARFFMGIAVSARQGRDRRLC
jgi:hypothetical protein